MDMATLKAGCALSEGQQSALAHITELKKKVKEQGETAQSPQILDSLIADETKAAEAWLRTAESPANTELWQQANRIHKELTLGSER